MKTPKDTKGNKEQKKKDIEKNKNS